MGYTVRHRQIELNTSSVADIAFLLLSFFLMTTVISDDRGLTIHLPEWRDTAPPHHVNDRNLFRIQINSNDELLVNGERISSVVGLREQIKAFVLNNGRDPDLSDSPKEAIVSLKTARGTSHRSFIGALDEIQGAYYEIYASRAGISLEHYRALNPEIGRDRIIINDAKQGIPMNISLAEPTN